METGCPVGFPYFPAPALPLLDHSSSDEAVYPVLADAWCSSPQ
jgi:hypothetical protein